MSQISYSSRLALKGTKALPATLVMLKRVARTRLNSPRIIWGVIIEKESSDPLASRRLVREWNSSSSKFQRGCLGEKAQLSGIVSVGPILLPQRVEKLTFIALLLVKKTAAEIKALKIEHAERARLRKQRREEQEANIARKRASSEKTSMQEEEEEEEENPKSEEEGDEADWDENDEVSESCSDSGSSDSESEKAIPLPKRAEKPI